MINALSVILLFLGLRTIAEMFLNLLNANHVADLRRCLPECLEGISDQKTWQRTTEYSLTKSRLGLWEEWYGALVFALVVAFFLPWAYNAFGGSGEVGPWREALAVSVILVLLQVPELPFEWYSQFRVEERFGFNKSTIGLWVKDKLKGVLLGFGAAIVAVIPQLQSRSGGLPVEFLIGVNVAVLVGGLVFCWVAVVVVVRGPLMDAIRSE